MLRYLGNDDPQSDTNDELEGTDVDADEEIGQEPAQPPETESEKISVLQQKIQDQERRIGNLERIVKVTQILNSTLTLQPLLQVIIQAATELTHTEAASIMLIDRNTGELRFAETTGNESENIKNVIVPTENSIAGRIIKQDRPLLIRDVREDPQWHAGVDESTNFETRSILGVPLKVRQDAIGVLEVVNKLDEDGFSADDIQIVSTLAVHAAIAIENARLLDEVQNAYRHLSEIDQIKGDFVSIASHELRTPLAVILGYVTFIRENASGEEEIEKLDIVLSSAMRLRSLIDDMVNLRHIKAEDVKLQRSIFSLRDLVQEVVQEFAEVVEGKQQVLTTRFSPSDNSFNLDADRQKIYLVLANLVSNAVKFTPSKGRIHLDVKYKSHRYWVDVIDTGIGIPESEYNPIFDQFYQVEPSLTRRYQGMGLGLSIAKGMIEVHRGRIWVESVVGKGSKFSFVLPTAPDVE